MGGVREPVVRRAKEIRGQVMIRHVKVDRKRRWVNVEIWKEDSRFLSIIEVYGDKRYSSVGSLGPDGYTEEEVLQRVREEYPGFEVYLEGL